MDGIDWLCCTGAFAYFLLLHPLMFGGGSLFDLFSKIQSISPTIASFLIMLVWIEPRETLYLSITVVLAVVIGAVVSPVIWLSGRVRGRKNWIAATTFSESGETQPRLLAISSRLDEAWQVLHHIRNAGNPLAVRSSIFKYLAGSMRLQISRSNQVSYIYGARTYRHLGIVAKCALAVSYLLATYIFFLLCRGIYELNDANLSV